MCFIFASVSPVTNVTVRKKQFLYLGCQIVMVCRNPEISKHTVSKKKERCLNYKIVVCERNY